MELGIARDHPAYTGHFPGIPILPGAVLLDAVLLEIARSRALDLLDWRVSSLKFLDIVSPGDPLCLEHTSRNDTAIRFAVRSGERAIASGLLIPHAA